jgi:hypothetical protein
LRPVHPHGDLVVPLEPAFFQLDVLAQRDRDRGGQVPGELLRLLVQRQVVVRHVDRLVRHVLLSLYVELYIEGEMSSTYIST